MSLGDATGIKPLDRRTVESITKELEQLRNQPPSMTCVNVFLNDESAYKHAVIKKIIMGCAGLSDSEADWYLFMRGVEEELKKFTVLGVNATNESDN